MTQKETLIWAIDSTGAVRGSKQFNAAILSAGKAVEKFDKAATGAFSRLSKMKTGTFATVAKDIQRLSTVTIKRTLARDLNALSDTLATFKGISKARVKNVRSLFNSLNALKIDMSSVSGLKSMSVALSTLKLPSAGKVAGIQTFFDALSKLKINNSIINSLTNLGMALVNFKGITPSKAKGMQAFATALSALKINGGVVGALRTVGQAFATMRPPTKAQTRNLTLFVEALNNMRVPKNARAIAAALTSIATAASRAGKQLKGLRGSVSSLGFSKVTSGAKRATGALRGFENAASASYAASSLLRTAFGALTVGTAIKGIFDATSAVEGFKVAINAVDPGRAKDALAFVYQEADRTGTSLDALIDRVPKLTASMVNSGKSWAATRDLIGDTNTVMSIFGANTEESKLVFLAMEQMFSKGTVSMEELKRQLGEKLPGAFSQMAKAAKKMGLIETEKELSDFISSGKMGAEAIQVMMRDMAIAMGDQLPNAMERAQNKLRVMQNQFFKLQVMVGDSGFMKALGNAFDGISDKLKSPEFQALAVRMGNMAGVIVDKTVPALIWMLDNIEKIIKGLGYMFAAFATKAAIKGIAALAIGFGNLVKGIKAATIAMRVFTIAVVSNPIVLTVVAVVAAFELLTGAISDTVTWFNNLKDEGYSTGEILRAVWETVKQVFTRWWEDSVAALTKFASIVQTVAGKVGQYFSDLWAGVTDKTDGVFTKFAKFFIGLGQWAGSAVVTVIDAFAGLVNALVRIASFIGETFYNTFKGIGEAASKLLDGDFKGAVSAVSAATSDIGTSFTRNLDEIKNGFTGATEKTAKLITDSLSSIGSATADAMNGVVDKAAAAGAQAGKNVSEAFRNNLNLIDKEKSQQSIADEYLGIGKSATKATGGGYVAGHAIKGEGTKGFGLLSGKDKKGKAAAARKEAKAAEAAAKATSDYTRALQLLQRQESAGLMTAGEALKVRESLNDAIENNRDPMKRAVAKLAEERMMLTMSNGELAVEVELRKQRQLLLKSGIDLMSEGNSEMLTAIEEQIRFNEMLRDPDSFNEFGKNVNKMGEQMKDFADSVKSDLGAAFSSMVRTGEADWAGMLDGWADKLLQMAFDNMISGIFSSATGGGGGGGLGGTIAGGIMSMFAKDGGLTSNPSATTVAASSSFKGAPHFQDGGTTANAGGGPIPAVLHQNEAVIPLKGGAVPVAMDGGGGAVTNNNTIVMNINTPDADSFRKSQSQITRDMDKGLRKVQSRDYGH